MILIPAEKKMKIINWLLQKQQKQQNLWPKAPQKCAALGPTHQPW